jgi:glutamate/aspartate transport system substrate-binding protein
MIRALKLSLLLLALSGCGLGGPPLTGILKNIKESGVIKMGYREGSVPFSYLDEKKQPIGYSIDLCNHIIEAVKLEIKAPNLRVELVPVTSSTRIPSLANGKIDMECGSTTNNMERQKQVAYTVTTFVAGNRILSKKSNEIKTLNDLKGRTVVSTAGSSNIKSLQDYNMSNALDVKILSAKDHAEAFAMLESGSADGFVMDDILLSGFAAGSKSPASYVMSSEAFSVEPYGIMLRKDNPTFKKIADNALGQLFKSGEINQIYSKWFQTAIPEKNLNFNLPMGEKLKAVIAKPNDSGDSSTY